MRFSIPLIMILAAVVAAPASAQSVKAGIDAWQKGNDAAAVAIWRPLAAKGDADAAFNLGQAYKLGRGVPLNLGRAKSFYEQAASKGHTEAQASLGLLLFQNNDRQAALRWLKAAADAGEPRAQLIYGTALFNGDGIPADPIGAYAMVSRAAAQGLAPARVTMSEMDQIIPADQREKALALTRQKTTPKTAATQARPTVAKRATLPASPTSGAWRIQLGAFSQRGAADALYAKLAGDLGGRAKVLVPSGTMTRLQVGPYATRTEAATACRTLSARGQACFPVPAR